MYSFPNLEPVCFPVSDSNCCFLTCIQISQEASKVVWYSHLFKNFPHFVVIHSCLFNLYAKCCCCCEVASVVSDSVQPHRRQPTRLLHPWDSPGKNTPASGLPFPSTMHACMLSRFSCVRLYVPPLSTGFSRQEHWSGLPFPSPAITLAMKYRCK